MSLQPIAQRLLNANIPLFWLADGRPAYLVEDLSLVNQDDPETSGFIIERYYQTASAGKAAISGSNALRSALARF